MGQLLKLLWDAVSGWIPLPEYRVEVAPWVFYPLFALLVAALLFQTTKEMREEFQQAKAQGQAKTYVWTTVILWILVATVGLWFIRS